MPKSNSPLALSVVSITEPDDVQATYSRMREFDERKFGFNHSNTLKALGYGLRGVLDPEAVAKSYNKEHPRVLACIQALFALGKSNPIETKLFSQYPSSGLRSVERIDWGPDVTVRLKAVCWYVENDRPVIPLLQPRKDPLSNERLAVLLSLGRQAFCKGDWTSAIVNAVDLSGDGSLTDARIIDPTHVPAVSDEVVQSYVETYVAAKRMLDESKTKFAKPKETKPTPMEELIQTAEELDE